MPNELTLTLGTTSLTIPLKGTQAQIRNVIQRYAIAKGLDITGLTQARIGRMALRYMVADAMVLANQQETQETLAAQNQTTINTISTNNNIVDLEDLAP